MYSIADLERISGVKAHTIRIWEKRYNLFNPDRTKGNHRLYDDPDLIRLLNVNRMVKAGYRISKVAAWEETDLMERIGNLEGNLETILEDSNYYIDEFIAAGITYDERRFEQAYKKVAGRRQFEDVWSHYLLPSMQLVGSLWLSKKMSPSQEHFLTALVRRKIEQQIDRLPIPESTVKAFLMFLPPGEYHELGLLMCHYFVRKSGIPVIYLGQNVPIENIDTYLQMYAPTCMMTFVQSSKMSKKFTRFLDRLTPADSTMVVAGNLHKEDILFLRTKEHIKTINSIEQIQVFIDEQNAVSLY